MMEEKIILIDCDGVILNWLSGFLYWAQKKGYRLTGEGQYGYDVGKRIGVSSEEAEKLIMEHNHSTNMLSLPPIPGSIHYMKKLYEKHGFVFHVISSCTRDERIGAWRTHNLGTHFGRGMFIDYTYLDPGEPKDEALKMYENSGCFWIEDHVGNANAGLKYGLTPMLLEQDHSKSVIHELSDEIPIHGSWKELYEALT